MNIKVVIIGAGGHGRVIGDTIKANGDKVVGFLDDNTKTQIIGYDYLGDTGLVGVFDDCYYIIAIGNNSIRKRIAKKYPNIHYYTAVHPSAHISPTVTIGKGSCVMPNATINSYATIGEHCIINSNVVVEHDCIVKDFAHLSPNVTASGTVIIGKNNHIGSGSSIINNVSICDDVIIGAGGVVERDITEPGTYVGVPVHKVH